MCYADFDPELTRPRHFVAPRPCFKKERAALASREKALLRELSPIENELAAVRGQLAALPAAA